MPFTVYTHTVRALISCVFKYVSLSLYFWLTGFVRPSVWTMNDKCDRGGWWLLASVGSVPVAEMVGSPDMFVRAGAIINLTCVISRSSEPPAFVFWYHNDRMINYDYNSVGRGDISVHKDPAKGDSVISRLVIRGARHNDSGNYTCTPSNADATSIYVHVLQGEYKSTRLVFLPVEIFFICLTCLASSMHLATSVFHVCVTYNCSQCFSFYHNHSTPSQLASMLPNCTEYIYNSGNASNTSRTIFVLFCSEVFRFSSSFFIR